jgi:hypothetical protein
MNQIPVFAVCNCKCVALYVVPIYLTTYFLNFLAAAESRQIMPNSVKKPHFPEETETVDEAEIDDFDFGSLDELATLMVEALTIPTPADCRNSEGSATDIKDKRTSQAAKRLN